MLRTSEAHQIAQDRWSAVGRLRSETRDLHSALDRHPILNTMKAGTVSKSDYRVYLCSMSHLLEDAFCAITPWADAFKFSGFDYLDERRRNLYELDLQEIDDALTNSLSSIQKPRPQLLVSGAAEASGVLYVVEGSTLGAKTLISPVRAALGHGLSNSTRGLACFGSETGRRWRNLCDYLDLALTDPRDLQRAINGARLTFKHTVARLGDARSS